jgi:hypothetical protein
MFFCLAGAWALQLRFELGVDDAVERFRGHVEGKLLAEPALDVEGTRQPAGGRQARLELGEDWGRQCLLPCRGAGLFVGQEGLEPSSTLAAEPGGHGITGQGEMRGGLALGGRLPRFEQH